MDTMKQWGQLSRLGTHSSLVVIWWLCISAIAETENFDFQVKFDFEGQGQSPPKL